MIVWVIIVVITNGDAFYVNAPNNVFVNQEICEISKYGLVSYLSPQRIYQEDIIVAKCVPMDVGLPT